ncbi:MAG: GNAT family N-acetyltransferase [Candidatus Pacebacteria bacterium]|nr:GNAT family N-acetyltransferase [Candidatus Paceibacterota bacterium]
MSETPKIIFTKTDRIYVPNPGKHMLSGDEYDFEIDENAKSLLGDKESAVDIKLRADNEIVGMIKIEDVNDRYVQLRLVGVEEKYQGGNAVELLYREAIKYAEEQNKELLFDSKLTIPAYKSFRKLDGEEFTVIQNPAAVLVEDGKSWEARGSWVLRVERKNKE